MVADRVRAAVTAVGRTAPAGTAVGLIERLVPWRPGSLAVLTYHRVDRPEAHPDLLPGLVSASPASFADQMDELVRHYRPVSMAEVLAARAAPGRLPPRSVLVTFDDAYADFAEHAWPVLRAAGVPATLFVPTAFPGDPSAAFWWDRLWAAVRTTELSVLPDVLPGLPALPLGGRTERLATMRALVARIKDRPHVEAMDEVDRLVAALRTGIEPRDDQGGGRAILDWATLRRLAGDGLTLGIHTRDHPLLDRVPVETAVEQICGARDDLEREIGPTLPVFAYPSGAHGGDAVEGARRAGMALAFTTRRGGVDLRRSDPLRLPRINVGWRAGAPLIRTQLVWASVFDARRR